MMHSGKATQAAIRLILYGLLASVGLVALAWLAYLVGGLVRELWPIVLLLYLVFVVFVLYFFRDPDPIAPSDPLAIVAPGHGKVDFIDETVEPEFMGGPCKRVSIFLSVIDIHVQNAPVHGKVLFTQHKSGVFLNAMRTDCGNHNENVLIGFQPLLRPEGEKVGVRLIAGLIARRIVPWVTAGDVIPRSERISLIQFGSRVDLYLPANTEIKVQLGDRVIGGQSIIAVFTTPNVTQAPTPDAPPVSGVAPAGSPPIRINLDDKKA